MIELFSNFLACQNFYLNFGIPYFYLFNRALVCSQICCNTMLIINFLLNISIYALYGESVSFAIIDV